MRLVRSNYCEAGLPHKIMVGFNLGGCIGSIVGICDDNRLTTPSPTSLS